MRLFCFPFAGGTPAAFFGWADALGPEIEVVCAQPPGRGARFLDKPHFTLDAWIEESLQAIAPHRDRPFALYGHSVGAWVAFEVIHRLRGDGRRQPVHFFAAASRAPHLGPLTPPIHQLPDDTFVQEIQRRYGGIPAEILKEPELMQMFLPVLRADFTAYETYVCRKEEPLAIPLTAITGSEDGLVTREIAGQWDRHTHAGFELVTLPGGHFFLNQNQSRNALLEVIQDRLFSTRS